MNVYLDNAATTPLSDNVKKYIISILDKYGNPSSVYSKGIGSKNILNAARKSIAKFINADSKEVIFTSSGSASNTLAINGYIKKHNCTILYSPLSHKSILECVKSYKNSFALKVDRHGFIDVYDLKEWLGAKGIEPFVVLPYADSEIGTIQDVQKIIDIVHFYNGIVYLDCTGSISSISVDVKKMQIDMLGFSGHKLNALKGIGVLYKKSNIELDTLIYGTQENGLFAGTENLLGIASIGKAVENYDYSCINSKNRDYVLHDIQKNIPDFYLVGSDIYRLPHNLYLCFKGIEGEVLMFLLDENGIQVSTGSACSSGDLIPSPILKAIGMDKEDIHSCIRMTFSGKETVDELDYVCKVLRDCVETLRILNK